jgi:hypothetical protein
MNETLRKEHQRHFIECCKREGWLDKDGTETWPEDSEKRATMGRGLLGLNLVHALDSTFITWQERANNPEKRAATGATPGSLADRIDQDWRRGFASMTVEQRQFVLRVIDEVLDETAYHFGITLDRFDHGELAVHLTVKDEEDQPKFTTQIQPHGNLEMFQDFLEWKKRFSRRSKTEVAHPEK